MSLLSLSFTPNSIAVVLSTIDFQVLIILSPADLELSCSYCC